MSAKKENTVFKGVQRQVGVVTATSIVVSNMIGAGVFTTSGIMAANLPDSGWVILCWLFGGLIAISGALCYAELATRMPEGGGEYIYLKRLFHPVFGFLTGWVSFVVGFSVPVAASALGFASYLHAGIEHLLPAVDPSMLLIFKKIIAIVIIGLFTGLHYVGLRFGARVQNVLTVLKVLLVFGLALAGLIVQTRTGVGISFHSGSGWEGLAVGTAMMLVMFAYSGWNASAYIAGEIKKPRRNLPISLITGTAIVIVIYLAINLFFFQSAPFSEFQGEITIGEKAAVATFGPWMGNVLSIFISLALLSSLSAFILIGPRIYFAMAKDRLFFSFASQVHPKYGVPSRSIVIQGLIAVVMVLVGSFDQLLVYLGFSLSIFPWMAVMGVFIARKREIGEDRCVKTWGYPVVPVFYLVSTIILMGVAYVNRPMESTIAVLTVLAGVPCYFIFLKRGKNLNHERS